MPVSKKQVAALEPYWKSECGRAVVYVGDCRDVMAQMEPEQFHSVVTDPPYGLEFMGKEWDAPWKQDGSVDARQRRAGEMVEESKRRYIASGVTYGGVGKRSKGTIEVAAEGTDQSHPFRDGTNRIVYGLSDPQGFQAWFLTCAEAMLRVAKPGAHLLSFGGTRMWHRMACAVEDAGWDIRDTVMWVYGSGFPKSHDVSKAIDKVLGVERKNVTKEEYEAVKGEVGAGTSNVGKRKSRVGDGTVYGLGHSGNMTSNEAVTDAARQWSGFGTALKPAHEPIILARKPMPGTVAQCVLENGTGALNIDGCRVGAGESRQSSTGGMGRKANPIYGQFANDEVVPTETTQGRWPANLIHDGSDEVVELFPYSQGNNGGVINDSGADSVARGKFVPTTRGGYGGDGGGSAARFFKTCKLTEEDMKWSWSEPAKDAENCFDLQSAFVASVLTHAVERSTQRLVLQNQSVQAQSMNVSETQLRLVCESLTETIQSSERRYSLGLPQEESTVRLGPVTCAAIPNQTGTTSITISLTISSHSVEAVTFNITPTSSEHGEQDSRRSRLYYTAKADEGDRPHGNGAATVHPTVKPLDLMRYLVRLVCARGGTVLDPFMGSGSTGCAAIAEGMRFVGIEQSQEYADIAVGRLRLALDWVPAAVRLEVGRRVEAVKDTPPAPRKLR